MKAFFNKKARILARRIKVSLREPFFYLLSSALILFGLILFAPAFPAQESSLVLDSSSLKSRLDQNPFVGIIGFQPESPDLNLVQNNSLVSVATPLTVTPQVMGAILGETELETRKEIIEYEVGTGDTIKALAERFQISTNTLLWANNLTSSANLKAGQKLIVLPVSGLLHHVRTGDSVSEIALKYQAKQSSIINFNDLSSDGDIAAGDILIIPDGVMPKNTVATNQVAQKPVGSSYFICPISSPCHITQGLHFYNAIDFSHGKCGDAIFAAAGGTVQKIKYGYNNGAGNYITILHPNGVVTWYGHIQSFLVAPGQQVYQGQKIATMGGQPGTPGAGLSTGCHVHFGVIGATNPFAY